MREVVDSDRVERFLRELGREGRAPGRIYLTGGGTAVLIGWRQTTVDLDLKLVPEDDRLLRAIARLKDTLSTNVEMASPDQFIPVPPGWEDRSVFIGRYGGLDCFHFDPTAQALAKIERGHPRDLDDVQAMIERGYVTVEGLERTFAAIEPELFRYPAVDPTSFRKRLQRAVARASQES